MGKMLIMIVLTLVLALPAAATRAEAAPATETGLTNVDEKLAMEEARMEKEVGITPEQREKMKALQLDLTAKQNALSAELKVKKEALTTELDNEPLNRAKVNGLVAEVKALQGKLLDNRIEKVFQLRSILSASQYRKLREMGKKWHADNAMASRPKPPAPAGKKAKAKK